MIMFLVWFFPHNIVSFVVETKTALPNYQATSASPPSSVAGSLLGHDLREMRDIIYRAKPSACRRSLQSRITLIRVAPKRPLDRREK